MISIWLLQDNRPFVAYNAFVSLYHAKFEKACECLTKDKDILLTFYDFPCEHWIHIRSTNVIESTFATVRLRTKKTKVMDHDWLP